MKIHLAVIAALAAPLVGCASDTETEDLAREAQGLVASVKIPILPSMVHVDAGRPAKGNYQNLFDEQTLIGDPRAGTGSAPQTDWNEQSWVPGDYPMGFYVDLGQAYAITELGFYDTYNTDGAKFDVGSPDAWTNVVTTQTDGWMSWKIFPVSVTTRYVHFSKSMYAGLRELVIYGAPVAAPPATAKIPLSPSMIRLDPARPAKGNYATMVDEQGLAGDPVFGTGGTPVTSWSDQSWQAADYPAGFHLDLGKDYVVTHVAYFDTFSTDSVSFDVGSPDTWTRKVTDTSDGWQQWKVFPIGAQTRYVKYARGMFAGVNEILVYGYPADPGGPNQPPTVTAGANQSVVLPTASALLDGSATDSDGSIASYAWAQTGGPNTATLQNANAAKATASGLVAGTYTFRLTATDDDGASSSATTNVVVHAATGQGTSRLVVSSAARPGGYGYFEYLPAGYEAGSNWPVVIFLHGQGERGSGSATDVAKVKANGPPRYVTAEGKAYPFVLIAPQTNGSWSGWEAEHHLDPFVAWVSQTYDVDPKRVYMTGLSMGGSGTWAYARHAPNKLAGILVACGGDYGPSDANGAALVSAGVAVWAAHATDDEQLNENGDVGWFNVIGHALGATSDASATYPATSSWLTAFYRPGLGGWEWVPGQTSVDPSGSGPSYPALLTLYPTGGHAIWDRLFKDQQVWDWLLTKHRP
jgi:poly(3-hydroxybutyrate) depolymerase